MTTALKMPAQDHGNGSDDAKPFRTRGVLGMRRPELRVGGSAFTILFGDSCRSLSRLFGSRNIALSLLCVCSF